MNPLSCIPARADACTEAAQHPVVLLLKALTAIVQETMAPPAITASRLPPALVDQAQRALARYGAQVVPAHETGPLTRSASFTNPVVACTQLGGAV